MRQTRWGLSGMFFSNVVMYFIILSTASTLYKADKKDIDNQPKPLKHCGLSPSMPRAFCSLQEFRSWYPGNTV